MSQTATTSSPNYIFRWATKRDFGRVTAVFCPTHIGPSGNEVKRPKTVFQRKPGAFSDAIENNRLAVLTDPNDNIKALGALHLLPSRLDLVKPLKGSGANIGNSVQLYVAEIGSIYRPADDPAGFCLQLMYDALILQTLLQAKDVLIANLVTQIVANNDDGIRKLMRLNQGWGLTQLAQQVKGNFHDTLAEATDKETKLVCYGAPLPQAVVSAAKSLCGMRDDFNLFKVKNFDAGIIEAHDPSKGENVSIDVSPTGLLAAAKEIVYRAGIRRTADKLPTLDWMKLYQALLSIEPEMGYAQPPEPSTRNYHRPTGATEQAAVA